MSLPIEELTPSQIVTELDRYIVGQNAAKKAVAVALRNRFRRLQLPADVREDILPKNILMIGPTGVGKTEIARRLAQLARAPFVKVEATKFTEVGYVGRDVESMVRDLTAAVRLVEQERVAAAWPEAERIARERIVEQMLDDEISTSFSEDDENANPYEEREKRRVEFTERFEKGDFMNAMIETEIEEKGSSFLQAFTPQGMEEISLDMMGGANPFGGGRTVSYRKIKVKDALPIMIEQEAKRLMESGTLNRDAIQRAEETGIIFIDEIDKVAIKSGSGSGPDVSREGVQRDLLPIIEGSTVATKFGPVRTDHVLFITAGAFHMAKPGDLIPELQGRLPIRVELESLSEDDFRRILKEPKNALTKQYQQLLSVDNVQLAFTDDAIEAIAAAAKEVNSKTENIGARRLHTIMERLLQAILFDAPYAETKTILFDRAKVKDILDPLLANLDSNQRIL